MPKKNEYETLQSELTNEFKNAWDQLDSDENERVFDLSEKYKTFLDKGKTERECALEILKAAKKKGFKNIEELIEKGEALEPGTKVYAMNREKAIALFVLGTEPIKSGLNVVGTHIDAPRIDLKANPLYEDSELALMKTHYYGGIKKYQWVTIPLALHGTVIKADGEKINVVIGEDEKDPIFHITDVLPHLGKDQAKKKVGEAITGEGLNIVVGNIPYGDDKIKNKIKLNVLKLLNEKYGIVEKDFINAEFEIVPAGKARDVGFDRGMISAYGHDDRVCSFAALEGVLEIDTPKRMVVAYFADKEEVGSNGNTGAESDFFVNCVAELLALEGDYNDLFLRRALSNTKVLSGDVCAPQDPNFPSVTEKMNTGYMGRGVQITKYTGARGKAGCNDANAEFIAEVSRVFDEHKITWQVGELGKVDQGGGGTIAYILANANAEVVDCGVPVLSMHAPYEVISKVDLYMAYKGYKAFLEIE